MTAMTRRNSTPRPPPAGALYHALVALGLLASCGDGASPNAPPDDAPPGAAGLDAALDGAPDAPPDLAPGLCRSVRDCQGGDFCASARVCRDGRCGTVGGVPSCDDGITCTADRCDGATGRCEHAPSNALCPAERYCDPEGGCVAPPSCEAGDTPCRRLNHDPCGGVWSCDPATLRCARSAAYDCDDHNACTADACRDVSGAAACEHQPVANDCRADQMCGRSPSGCFACGACDDGVCVEGACLRCGPCETLAGGRCVPAADGSTCASDANACTTDQCLGGRCDHSGASPNDCGTRDCGRSGSGCFACGPLDGRCPEGLFCQMGRCVSTTCPECHRWDGAACVPAGDGGACADDRDNCTRDICAAGACVHPRVTNDCGGRQCGPSPSGCVGACGHCASGEVCSGGVCTRPACGNSGEPCCSGACYGSLVCNRSGTCQGDTAVTTTVYRYVSLCTSAHWHAIGSTATCYPSSSGPTVACGCGTRVTNPGCSSPTCWRREIAFTSALLNPSFGTFEQIYHCFEGGANRYSTAGCSSYGDPTSIGWLARASVGAWSVPVYLCRFNASGADEQFFSVSAGECPGGPVGTWYARP